MGAQVTVRVIKQFRLFKPGAILNPYPPVADIWVRRGLVERVEDGRAAVAETAAAAPATEKRTTTKKRSRRRVAKSKQRTGS